MPYSLTEIRSPHPRRPNRKKKSPLRIIIRFLSTPWSTACNQKSNRDPEMHLDDDAVLPALRTLEQKGLAGKGDNMDGRVKKYEHRLADVFNFTRPETAVLCELLLRGPQTPGELRSRAERMHHFDDLDSVNATLRHLIERDPPLAKLLPRQPGTKEARHTQLLSGDEPTASESNSPIAPVPTLAASSAQSTKSVIAFPQSAKTLTPPTDAFNRITQLEQTIQTLEQEISDLKQQFANFRKQFE